MEDTDLGGLPWLVSPPASDNLKSTQTHHGGQGGFCIIAVCTLSNIH
jgi:hypothetical protein